MFRLLLVAFLVSAHAVAAAADFRFSPAPGPLKVGFRVIQQYDQARVYQRSRNPVTAEPVTGERARPLQTLVWYPAGAGGAPLLYRDYVATVATEEDFGRGADEARRATDTLIDELAAGLRGDQLRREMEQPVRALRDAPEQPGSFPVVIYAPSHGASAIENADLCEFLASHGYVVIASPSMGPRSRAMTPDLEGAEAQAADIAFLVGYAHTLAQADMGRIAVVGFSWGGLANVLAAARDDRIRALVSLEGSLRAAAEYVNGGPRAAKYVTAERLGVPLLYVGRRSEAGLPNLLVRMRHADIYAAAMQPMRHMDFSSWSLRVAPDAAFQDHGREDAALAYGWVARYVQRFLDARLKDDGEARVFLAARPEANGVPRKLMNFDVRRSSGPPPTMDTFLEQLGRRGFEHIDAIYDQLHASNPELSFDPLETHDWGLRLLRERRPRDALQVFKLGVRLYPDRFGFLYDGLGQACEAMGDPASAVAHYRHALELEAGPARAHARERLEALAH